MAIRRVNGHAGPPQHKVPARQATGGVAVKVLDFLLDAGVRAERRGELHAALELYSAVVSTEPDSGLAWYNHGDVLLAMGRHEEAVTSLQKAAALAPDVALVHYDLGLALFHLGRNEEAHREFAVITERDPGLKRASSALGLMALTNKALAEDRLGRPDLAAGTLAPALRTAVDILYNLGRVKWRTKRPEEAATLLQAAALLQPESEEIVHGAGRALMDLKRESEALLLLTKATKLNPLCVEAWYDLGVTLSRLGQRKKARSCFRQALRVDATYAWAHYDLACLDALEGKRQSAFEQIDKAIAKGFRDIAHLRKDSDLKALQKDARWKPLLKRLGELASVRGE